MEELTYQTLISPNRDEPVCIAYNLISYAWAILHTISRTHRNGNMQAK